MRSLRHWRLDALPNGLSASERVSGALNVESWFLLGSVLGIWNLGKQPRERLPSRQETRTSCDMPRRFPGFPHVSGDT